MVFDFSVALTWILFLALFPLAFFWLRWAWRILCRRDFSGFALKAGSPPPDATWSAIAGSTIWCKFFVDFIISRHAHKTAPKEAPR